MVRGRDSKEKMEYSSAPARIDGLSEQELAARAKAGEQEAFGELVCRLRDPVVRVVYRMCADGPLAEEAAQEAFLRAWQHLGRYRPELSFRSWVMGIAVHAAIDALRRERPAINVYEESLSAPPELGDGSAPAGESDGPEGAVLSGERARAVRRAVMGLAPASRAALVLREFGGLSYAEIAEVLNIPLGTVMSRLNAARTQLRRELANLLEGG